MERMSGIERALKMETERIKRAEAVEAAKRVRLEKARQQSMDDVALYQYQMGRAALLPRRQRGPSFDTMSSLRFELGQKSVKNHTKKTNFEKGNAKMQANAILAQRRALRHDPRVKAALDAWWVALHQAPASNRTVSVSH